MQARSKSDHAWKNCTEPGCDRPLRARGKCGTCYNKAHQQDRHSKTRIMQCFVCDKDVVKSTTRGSRYTVVCSNECRNTLTFGTPLPDDHWVRWYGKSSAWTPPKPVSERPAFISNQCDECGSCFIEANHGQPSLRCSKRCTRRVMKRARKARQHGSPGSFRWVEVIRIWIAAGKQCSYCDEVMTGQPDPDHVVPISRGGRNDLGNIVPCCRLCNADKNDLTLAEWATERAKQGKPALRYVLPFTDPRFKHLTMGEATGSAWRHAMQLAA